MIKKIFSIAKREIKSSFVTPLSYILMCGLVLITGFFFFSLLQRFNSIVQQASVMAAVAPQNLPSLNEWVINPLFQTLCVVLIFLLPILSMRLIAEEKKSGTFELLATSPITTRELVLGKFIGSAFVLVCCLALTFVFPAILVLYTDPEILPVLTGFLGVVLFGLAYLALGLAISTFTKHQTVAGIISLVACLLFYVIDAPAGRFGERISAILTYLSPAVHTQNFLKGLILSSDIVYFLSFILIFLFVAVRALDSERLR